MGLWLGCGTCSSSAQLSPVCERQRQQGPSARPNVRPQLGHCRFVLKRAPCRQRCALQQSVPQAARLRCAYPPSPSSQIRACRAYKRLERSDTTLQSGESLVGVVQDQSLPLLSLLEGWLRRSERDCTPLWSELRSKRRRWTTARTRAGIRALVASILLPPPVTARSARRAESVRRFAPVRCLSLQHSWPVGSYGAAQAPSLSISASELDSSPSSPAFLPSTGTDVSGARHASLHRSSRSADDPGRLSVLRGWRQRSNYHKHVVCICYTVVPDSLSPMVRRRTCQASYLTMIFAINILQRSDRITSSG